MTGGALDSSFFKSFLSGGVNMLFGNGLSTESVVSTNFANSIKLGRSLSSNLSMSRKISIICSE